MKFKSIHYIRDKGNRDKFPDYPLYCILILFFGSDKMNKQEIYDIIKSLPEVDGNGAQLRMRCFICGDSKKNRNKKRLGIKIDVNNPLEPILYNCFNCGEHGVITTDMLCDMGLAREVASEISQFNRGVVKSDTSSKVNKYKNYSPIPVIIPPPTKCDKTYNKIKYLSILNLM